MGLIGTTIKCFVSEAVRPVYACISRTVICHPEDLQFPRRPAEVSDLSGAFSAYSAPARDADSPGREGLLCTHARRALLYITETGRDRF